MANGITIRSSIESLENTPNGLDPVVDAYTKMQGISDNRGWIYWAEIHGFPQYLCWHHGRLGSDQMPYDLFLPWHRAYLLYFEHTIRDQNANATLPYWDWTSNGSHQNGIPNSYQATAGLSSGPMPAIQRHHARPTQRNPDDPAALPTQDDVNKLIALDQFLDFSTQVQDVHDNVHGWVGGDMGVIATSAFDPIFWSHHCMIDRIWYLWQLENGVNNIPPDYLDKALGPFSLTVRDVLDINRIGYEYAQASIAVNA
jgi:tyrosinase